MILDDKLLKQRYEKRISGVRDKKIYIGPEVVSLRIGNACNLRCQYCWTHAPGNPLHFAEPHFFPIEKFYQLVRDCVELEVDQLHITAEGEPTMHPAFREMMSHLEQQPLKIKLFTNATFPLDWCSDVIKGDHAVVDLSAVEPEQYRIVQGKDLFHRVVTNIKRLAALRDSVKPTFVIEIAYILNELNIKQKDEMLRLGSEMGVTFVDFKKMNAHQYNRNILLSEGSASEDDFEGIRTPGVCANGWFLLEGSASFSSMCCRINKMGLETFGTHSIKDIWFSKRLMDMRILGKYGQVQKMYKACQTCPYYEWNIEREKAAAVAGEAH